MVFLFIFLSIIIMIVILLIFSKVKIEIINFNFFGKIPKAISINKDYKIIIKLVILKKLPIIRLELTKKRLEKLKLKDKMKNANAKAMKMLKEDKNQKIIRALKELDITIQNMNLEVKIGTENASFTAILVAIVSTLVSMLLKKHIKKYKSQTFKIQPVYYNQNLVNIEFSGIFEIKMIHIINIIYILNKKEGVKKYERTSNRRAYGYSYE